MQEVQGLELQVAGMLESRWPSLVKGYVYFPSARCAKAQITALESCDVLNVIRAELRSSRCVQAQKNQREDQTCASGRLFCAIPLAWRRDTSKVGSVLA